MKPYWSLHSKQLPCQSTDPKLVIFLLFIATALLVMLCGSKLTKRHDKDDVQPINIILVLDFFKQLDRRSTDDERDKNLGMAIRYLDQLTKQSIEMRKMDATYDFQGQPWSVMQFNIMEAAMLALKVYPQQDELIYMAFTLLSLVANGNDDIQRRLWEDPNHNDIEFFIKVMRDSLNRAKMEEEPTENEERLSAEIQRKGCLLLGGFDNVDASTKIIKLGGLSVLIDAMQWYRFHAGVCKWALWAVFNLCYDRPKHQCEPLRYR